MCPTADVYPQILAREIGLRINPDGILEVIPVSPPTWAATSWPVSWPAACRNIRRCKGLIDIGTNGEIAIGNNEWLVCCSASAGSRL